MTVIERVSVVILNWNGKDDTLECLQSLTGSRYAALHVVVVDNGSTDDSVKSIKQRFPAIDVLETGANLGFAEGNNVGIRHALATGADYVLLLNNDTTVAPDVVEQFLLAARENPRAGVIGGKVLYFEDPDVVWSVAVKWLPEQLDFVLLGDPDLYRSDPVLSSYSRQFDFNVQQEVESIIGCSMFIRRSVFEKIGFLDSKYFLTWEETDFCVRTNKGGFVCLYAPAAKIWHKIGKSFGHNSPMRSYFNARNRIYWVRKHLGARAAVALYARMIRELFPAVVFPAVPAAGFSRRFYWGLSAWFRAMMRRYQSASFRSILIGFWDGVIGRHGNCPDSVRNLRSSGDAYWC